MKMTAATNVRLLARIAVLAAPLLVAGGLSVSPALADGGPCFWNGNGFAPGALVQSNGVTFSCSNGGSSPSWVTTGQSDVGFAVDGSYSGNNYPGYYSPGATLEDSYGNAWSLGSTWDELGSWDDFYNQVVTDSSGGTGGGSSGDEILR